MRSAPFPIDSTDAALLLGLTMRRLGQVWRRALPDTPDSWPAYADRIGPEMLPKDLHDGELGRTAHGVAGADPANRSISGLQAVTVWADALAAGFAYTPGTAIAGLETDLSQRAYVPTGAARPMFAAQVLHADRPPLYWPLVPQPERPEPLPKEALPKPIGGETDNATLYRPIWESAKRELAALPTDPGGVAAKVLELLDSLRHIPVVVAGAERVVGLRDHVWTAARLAFALRRALRAKLDDGPSTWVDPTVPYWALAAFHLGPANAPADALRDGMARLRVAVATAVGESAGIARPDGADSWDWSLAELGPRGRLLLLPIGAADAVNRAFAAARDELAPRLALGMSGMPLAASSLVGESADVAALAGQVAAEARRRATVSPAGRSYAEWFGPAAPAELRDAPPLAARPLDDQADLAPGAGPATAWIAPGGTRPGEFDRLGWMVPPFAGTATSELAALLHQADFVDAQVTKRLAGAAAVREDLATWRVRAEIATAPSLTAEALAAYLLWWGNRPPIALSAGVVAGDDSAAARAAWSGAANWARPLPAHAEAIRTTQPDISLPEAVHGGTVSLFPRFPGDSRSYVPSEDVPVVLGLAVHVLGLAGSRRDDETGQAMRVGRGDGTVARLCREAATRALPEAAPGAAANGRVEGWRAWLTYRLMRLLGMRRMYSRKRKATPTPIDQLVDAVRANRWEALQRPVVRDALLYLATAARWTDAVQPPPGAPAGTTPERDGAREPVATGQQAS